MKKKYLNVLEEMQNAEDVKGKKLIERLIWLNTTEPRFKVGECYQVTDLTYRVFGVRVKNFNGKLIEARPHSAEKMYTYKFELEVEAEGTNKTVEIVTIESNIGKKVKHNLNVIAKKSEYAETIDVRF